MATTFRLALFCLVSTFAFSGCLFDILRELREDDDDDTGQFEGEGDGPDEEEGEGDDELTAEEFVNENLGDWLPPGAFRANIDDYERDNSIVVNVKYAHILDFEAKALFPDQTAPVSVTFSAPNANVSGLGIRMGTSGPLWIVPQPGVDGQTSGTLQTEIDVPASVCNNLSDICHEIRCFEFAVTDAGRISQSNISQIALACGNCDEPSCATLIQDACEEGEDLGTGDVQVTLTWDSSTDVDLHVVEPSGEEIWFGDRSSATGGQLDVDNTVAFGPENIFWPVGSAPNGTYSVYVHYYSTNGFSGVTNYTVFVRRLQNGAIDTDTFNGTLSTPNEQDLVTTFTFP